MSFFFFFPKSIMYESQFYNLMSLLTKHFLCYFLPSAHALEISILISFNKKVWQNLFCLCHKNLICIQLEGMYVFTKQIVSGFIIISCIAIKSYVNKHLILVSVDVKGKNFIIAYYLVVYSRLTTSNICTVWRFLIYFHI